MATEMFKKVLVIGEDALTVSIAVNLLQSGAQVLLLTHNKTVPEQVSIHFGDIKRLEGVTPDTSKLQYVSTYEKEVELVIVVTEEELEVKKNLLKKLDAFFDKETTITVNSDSFLLASLKEATVAPERIIGLNWTMPAHTTRFLEIITDNNTDAEKANSLQANAEKYWQKDPYTVNCGYSIRARMMAALAREALYLVEHGYATVDDIDRANRNDAGYYLPFAGNCRYMDLMGTYAYGLVMKDLNRELSKADKLPDFFDKLVETENLGFTTGNGFYAYTPEEIEDWLTKSRQFGYEIREIIDRFPFGYLTEEGSIKQINEKTSHI